MKRSIKDLVVLEGKRVLLRTDFNVPMDKVGRITDTSRIVASLPTIKYLMEKKAKIIICTHLGKPDGFDIKLSLWPISLILMKYFPGKVLFSQKIVGDVVKEQIANMQNGSILLLENVRFDERETQNDPTFVRELASLADIYVNDAFATCHRKHASTYGVSRMLPNAVGLLVEEELNMLSDATKNPKHPYLAIFGGKKVDDKIKVIESIMEKADSIIIGGAMAYPFLVAQGHPKGANKINSESIEIAFNLLEKAKKTGKKILLPVDHIVLTTDKKQRIITVEDFADNMVGYDIGPKTVKLFENEIFYARQIIWNGPLGMFEDKRFNDGTKKIAEAIAQSRAYSIVGGGDTAAAVKQSGKADYMGYISTGGGATLKFLENNSLPCIDIIQEVYL